MDYFHFKGKCHLDGYMFPLLFMATNAINKRATLQSITQV